MRRRTFLFILVAGILATMPDCASRTMVKSVTLRAEDQLNPNRAGEPQDVVWVRIYLLSDSEDFISRSYDELWKKEKLDSEFVVDRKETQIGSLEKKVIKFEVPKELKGKVRFVGLVVGYADPQDGGWRRVLSADKKSTVVLDPRSVRRR